MDNEQNNQPEPQEDTGKIYLTDDSTLQTQDEFNEDKDNKHNEEPHPVITTNIGDGVMRDEGLAENGDPDDIQFEAGGVIPSAPDDQDR